MWLLWIFWVSKRMPVLIWAHIVLYRFRYRPSWNLAWAIVQSIMLLVHILLSSLHLSFGILPILNGWFYSNQQIVVLTGWDGEDESARDETKENVDVKELVNEMTIGVVGVMVATMAMGLAMGTVSEMAWSYTKL